MSPLNHRVLSINYSAQKIQDLKNQKEFVYSANAHPEIANDGILVTYNVNSGDFNELIENENIYFPKFISIKITK